jgi:hypothetical protein
MGLHQYTEVWGGIVSTGWCAGYPSPPVKTCKVFHVQKIGLDLGLETSISRGETTRPGGCRV